MLQVQEIDHNINVAQPPTCTGSYYNNKHEIGNPRKRKINSVYSCYNLTSEDPSTEDGIPLSYSSFIADSIFNIPSDVQPISESTRVGHFCKKRKIVLRLDSKGMVVDKQDPFASESTNPVEDLVQVFKSVEHLAHGTEEELMSELENSDTENNRSSEQVTKRYLLRVRGTLKSYRDTSSESEDSGYESEDDRNHHKKNKDKKKKKQQITKAARTALRSTIRSFFTRTTQSNDPCDYMEPSALKRTPSFGHVVIKSADRQLKSGFVEVNPVTRKPVRNMGAARTRKSPRKLLINNTTKRTHMRNKYATGVYSRKVHIVESRPDEEPLEVNVTSDFETIKTVHSYCSTTFTHDSGLRSADFDVLPLALPFMIPPPLPKYKSYGIGDSQNSQHDSDFVMLGVEEDDFDGLQPMCVRRDEREATLNERKELQQEKEMKFQPFVINTYPAYSSSTMHFN